MTTDNQDASTTPTAKALPSSSGSMAKMLSGSYRIKIIINPEPRCHGDFEIAASVDGDPKDAEALKTAILEIAETVPQVMGLMDGSIAADCTIK